MKPRAETPSLLKQANALGNLLKQAWYPRGRLQPAACAGCAKYRLFVFVPIGTIPDSRIVAITREDDYFFGMLYSRIHEAWSLVTSPRHGVGNDPTHNAHSCFETFPFPWLPGQEDQDDPRVVAIAEAARELVRLRDEWLASGTPALTSQPPLPDRERGSHGSGSSLQLPASSLKDRTLTNLYNKRPDWLDLAHKRLDAAVFDAYGWPHGLSDDEILARLLALNLERAVGQEEVLVAAGDKEDNDQE